jgi:hypothetical protein
LCSTWENELTVPSWWFSLFWFIIVFHGCLCWLCIQTSFYSL